MYYRFDVVQYGVQEVYHLLNLLESLRLFPQDRQTTYCDIGVIHFIKKTA